MRVLRLRRFLPLLFAAAAAAQTDGLHRRVAVPLHGGRLDVAELLRELAAAYDFDARALPLPPVTIDVGGADGRACLLAARALSFGTVRLEPDEAAQRVDVVVDRERARDVRRAVRAGIAELIGRAVGERVAVRAPRLLLPDPVDRARPLVVLLHGIESSPDSLAELGAFLDARGVQVANVDWPNDGALDRVAAQVAAQLRALGEQRVVLVGHSSGGLIARAIVEDDALDPGNVERLVLLGVPNGGSEVAALRALREAWNVARTTRGAEPQDLARAGLAAVLLHWRDGRGEAGGDVLPGSVFLTRLAARARNPAVRYHAVLGTRSLLTAAQHAALTERVVRALGDEAAGRFVLPKVERWLDGLDEWVDGQGDGAVGVAAGALDGVEPVLVPLDHRGLVRTQGLLGAPVAADAHPVFRLVAEWVTSPR